tara:strand:+ start:46447 stop:46974 length:528 start_codon:yes stop_codon:yes gene_type:complete
MMSQERHRLLTIKPVPVEARDVLYRVLFAAFLWWVLSEGRADSWGFGVLMALLVTGISLGLFPPVGPRLRWRRLPGYLLWFAGRSLLAGVDVARRLLAPGLPLNPGRVTLDLDLPDGPPRWWLANSLSLLPGTLSVALHGQQIEVHTLDTRSDIAREVEEARRRVGVLYGEGTSP